MEKEKEERADQTGKKGLGKEESEQGGVKVSHRDGFKGIDKQEDEPSFQNAENEGEQALEGESFQVESFLQKLRNKKNERSGEGVKAEGVSGKQVHEISHEKCQDPAEGRRE